MHLVGKTESLKKVDTTHPGNPSKHKQHKVEKDGMKETLVTPSIEVTWPTMIELFFCRLLGTGTIDIHDHYHQLWVLGHGVSIVAP